MEDAAKLGKKLTAHYSAIQAITIMGYCPMFSFATVYLLERGFSNSQVGLTLTLSNAVALTCMPFITAFADKTKKFSLRSLVALAMGVVAFFSILLYITPALVLPTAILFVILNIFFAVQVTFVTTMSMEHINNGVPINFSLARGIGSFAFAILSYLMGYLVRDYGASTVMLFNIAFGVVGIGLVMSFQKAKKVKALNAIGEEDAAIGLLDFLLSNKRFLAVVLSVALIYFSHVLINTFFIRIFENVGGDSSDMGIAIAIGAFLELPAMALFPRIHRKAGNAGILLKIAGAFFVVKAVVTLLATSVFWIDAAQCLQFFAYALLAPASVFYVNEVICDADKNKGQGIMGGVMGISGIAGNLLGGLMLDSSGGVRFMLTTGVLVSLAGVVMLVLVDKRKSIISNH